MFRSGISGDVGSSLDVLKCEDVKGQARRRERDLRRAVATGVQHDLFQPRQRRQLLPVKISARENPWITE